MQVPTSVDPSSKTWPYVLAFAIEMERQLVENAHKDAHHPECQDYDHDGVCDSGPSEPGWLHGFQSLDAMQRIYEEANELRDATLRTFPTNTAEKAQAVTDEAADVGNMAMMLACISGQLKPYGGDPE